MGSVSPRSAPRAILFDLDGTLVDSRRDIAEACNFALETVGHPRLDEETIAGFVGDGARNLVGRALAANGERGDLEQALASFHAFYAEHAAVHTRWMRGAREAIVALSDLPLALVTNKPRAATCAVLRALGAEAAFASVIAGGDGPLKPHPGAVLLALQAVGVAAADAWLVGDGTQDILAGRAAGCRTIAVLGGFVSEAALSAAKPDVTISSLVELLPLVERARRSTTVLQR